MPIKKGYKQLLAEANDEIETIPSSAAITLLGQPDVVFVDLRDSREMKREGNCLMPLPAPGACWNSGLIQKVLIPSRFSPNRTGLSSSARVGGDLPLRRRRRRT